jgi:hypothetical protein
MLAETRFRYAAEKLAAARRALMAPHSEGEAADFVGAKWEFDIGTRGFRDEELDAHARAWVATIRQTFAGATIREAADVETAARRVERLTLEEKAEFAVAVDELANWFRRRAFEREVGLPLSAE